MEQNDHGLVIDLCVPDRLAMIRQWDLILSASQNPRRAIQGEQSKAGKVFETIIRKTPDMVDKVLSPQMSWPGLGEVVVIQADMLQTGKKARLKAINSQ